MTKELKKLKDLLNFYLERNDTKNILRIRKELLKLDGNDENVEELNNGLFD